ncbi:MAG: hypothetical protein OEZ10_05290 [Gammaproteobacteria bacterium]|nr:hypothetical protein [Gammaproteobacteria bacterium]
MIIRKLTALLLVPVLAGLLVTGEADARPRTEPVFAAETINYKGSVADAAKRVRKVIFRRKWEAKDKGAGHIRATYEKSSKKTTLMAAVNIKISGGKIRISYAGSEGFSYDSAAKTIHHKYNSWVANLVRDMRVEFGDY